VPVRSHYEGLPLMAGREETKAGQSPPEAPPGSAGPGTEKPHVERREALLSLARREETPPVSRAASQARPLRGPIARAPRFPALRPLGLGGAPLTDDGVPGAGQRTRAAQRWLEPSAKHARAV
jgi:hypothetical protein